MTELKRELSLRDLILFNITAGVTLRWISYAASNGPFTLLIWFLAFLFFFLPLGYVVIDFTRKMPKEGGLYQWTKSTFGPFHGFICAWCYVVNNLFYYPSLLVAIASYATYVFAGDNPALQENVSYIRTFSLIALWLILILNLIGVRFGKWVENIGGLSIWIPGMLVIILGLVHYFRSGSAINFSQAQFLPNFGLLSTWAVWQTLCFAFSGIELASTMSEEIKDPERNVPRSIYIAGIIIVALYAIGTLAVMVSVSKEKINLITGIIQAISEVLNNVGLGFLKPAVAILLTVGGLGTLGAWLAGPARLPYTVGVDRYLPSALGKIHPRWGTPYVSLLWLGVISTIILLMSSAGATVKEAYVQLTNATIIVYFIPYIYLFLSHIWMNWKTEKKPIPFLLALAGVASTLIAVILSALPDGFKTTLRYALIVDGGSLLIIVLSMIFYWNARRKMVVA
jgi:glutamate:GABA antiporter